MQVLCRFTKSKQLLQLLKVHPSLFDFPSHYQCPNYYSIKLLQTAATTDVANQFSCSLHAPNSEPPQNHCGRPPITPTPNLTIDSAKEAEAEAIYNSIHQFILAEGDEAIVPAGWVLSMVQSCRTYHDIKLLIFLLLKHQLLVKNPDVHLTQEITRACLCCGALHYAKSTMFNPNTFGFTPNIGSALLLLNYAEDHNDIKLMEETFHLLKINNLPIESDIAEIILRIYRNAKCLKKLFYHSKKFILNGIKFHQSSFEMIMESAADKGDVGSLKYFETARFMRFGGQHTCRSGFAYAKGLLLDGHPEKAGEVIIKLLCQYLPVEDEPRIIHVIGFATESYERLAGYRKYSTEWPEELMIEIKQLVNEWPAKIIKLRGSPQKKKERIAILETCIPTMVEYVSANGFELEELDLRPSRDEL